MGEIQRVQEQLDQSYNGPAWHGPGIKQNLDGVTAQVAAAQPIPGAHSIWELVQHLTAWMTEVVRTLDGEDYVVLTPEQDWPPVNATDDAAWESVIAIMDSTFEALLASVGDVPEEKVDQNLPGQEFTYYTLLHGVVSHSVYHAGQMGLLRKFQ